MKNQILKLRKDGLNYKEISIKLNCSKSTVSYHCKRNGMGDGYLKYVSFNISTHDVEKIIKLRKNKKTYDEIRKITNISIDKISYICRMNGIDDQNDFRKPLDVEIRDMQKYYDECGSCRKVAKKFGWSRITVAKYLDIKKSTQTVEERKKNVSESVVRWRRDKKLKLIEHKGGKCQICGYDKSTRSLNFHHINPDEKDFTISGKSYSYERLKKESEKCILLCLNCHGEVHDEIDKTGYSQKINKITDGLL